MTQETGECTVFSAGLVLIIKTNTYEVYCRLRCDAVQLGRCVEMVPLEQSYLPTELYGITTQQTGHFKYRRSFSLQQDTHCTCNVNIEERSSNDSCGRQAITITCSDCVFVALDTQHAMRIRHIVIGGLFSSVKFFYIIS